MPILYNHTNMKLVTINYGEKKSSKKRKISKKKGKSFYLKSNNFLNSDFEAAFSLDI